MPELMIWAAVGGVGLVTTPVARAAWLLAPLAAALPRLVSPLAEVIPVGTNGDPFEQIVVASQLLKNADPAASVAVIPAGIVPYFTRLYTIDLLGKNDAHVARLTPRQGASIGHGKIDPAYSFGMRPDYVVSCRPLGFAKGLAPIPPQGGTDYVRSLLASPEFQEGWQGNPVPDPFLEQRSAVYVRFDSPELDRLADWQGVTLAR